MTDDNSPLQGAKLAEVAVAAGEAALRFTAAAQGAVLARVTVDGRLNTALLERDQRIVHGFAWINTLSNCLTSTADWLSGLVEIGATRRIDELALIVGFNEYLSQLACGVPMAQNEIVRPGELGLGSAAAALTDDPAVQAFLALDAAPLRRALVDELVAGHQITGALHDDLLDQFRTEMRRFADERIIPIAHGLHLADALVPDALLDEMAELGIFGLCIDEAFGGMGQGKLAMCVVTEELSRAWIATGSLGTRAEIAGELIASAGTAEQKQKWLPLIASGACLPTAVFTEPDTGSDLGALRTRAARDGDGNWRVNGSKTWITHGARSDLMTILLRTDPATTNHEGLSILLAEKPRGTRENPFPAVGMSGEEIEVLGYRGMREYTIAFADFAVEGGGLLGGVECNGFRQLMQTFEGARIQTAARAIGVARRAMELGLGYAMDRKQFGKAIVNFPRVSDKIATMAAEILLARELTYASARQKDSGLRCDIEAGMAKLIAARVAWSAADAALQIHGGNGYALEYEISRVLVDARILNVFEGAAEIQAQVVARGLLQRSLSQKNG